ncbi:MAG: Fe-S-containing hydro-lyase [Candidatus Omnitrophota bacterium]
MKNINLPFTQEIVDSLKAGDELLLSGLLYTARDAAHKRLCVSIEKGEELPVDLTKSTIYYCGPTPAAPSKIIGSCGPTTAKRMDSFTPQLLSKGLKVMIGKGNRSEDVVNAIQENNAVYLTAIGGAAAYLAKRVKGSRVVAYSDLGPEAIYELRVENFPVTVAIDSKGNNIYDE